MNKRSSSPIIFCQAALLALVTSSATAEPLLSSWHTAESGSYARIFATQEDEALERGGGAISSLTTWDSADYDGVIVGDQPLPVYAGVQGISYSDDYVYIKSTGLATNTMGPWFLNSAQTTTFPSFPGNAAILYRFPRVTDYPESYAPATRTPSNIGTCGLFVDGVPLFNTSDTFSYDTSAGGDQRPTNQNRGDGYWNRDAFTNEGVTFDAGNAHQAMEAFHYHASPVALRHTLGDSVDYDASVVYQGVGRASPYTENFNGQHSPIIAWANDGLPMYGPYGYGDPDDAMSDVRLMVSGYQKRDGSNGSSNLAATGRTNLPRWVVSEGFRNSTAITAQFYGPAVSSTFVLGHYMEDYAYKGHLGLTQGIDFDLNEQNVRYCVTPEFPGGTWAYFTSVKEDGTPIYPYNLAYNYFGDAARASGVTEIAETVTEVFGGAADIPLTLRGAKIDQENDEVTIVWNGKEGGQYELDTSTDLENWTVDAISLTATSGEVAVIESGISKKFYRIEQTDLATYDTTEFSTAAGGGPGGPGGGGPGGGGPGGGGPGGGGGETPGTGSPAAGFVFSFTDGPPMANLASNIKVGNVTGIVVAWAIDGPRGGTATISFSNSSFVSGQSYTASFVASPPGGAPRTSTSTNSYRKP
ncbi:MAG: YHYH protein [Akkermansiaceae bacterium]|nr:YHYH protein [Akkermansiaceae bacterium]